jgi:hypothetical protein
MSVIRTSSNQRNQDLAEADEAADSGTYLEFDAEAEHPQVS